MKKITIIGRVGKDAEIRRLQDGTPILNFNVAVNDPFKKDAPPTWFGCSFFGTRGEKIAQYVTKGSQLAVVGDFGLREYEGKTYAEVRVSDVELLGGGKRDGGDEPAQQERQTFAQDLDSEIPF